MDTRTLLSLALNEARTALDSGDYPFGAVVTDKEGAVVATGRNENFTKKDITTHAEMQCLSKIDINELLDENKEFHIFCSGEPCGGCSFFIAKTKSIKYVTWALTDPQKAGFDDLRKNTELAVFFENIEVIEEPLDDLKEKSASLLKQYYQNIGKPNKVKLY